MNGLLARIRKIDSIFERKSAADFSFGEICKILSELMNSNAYIVNNKGRILGVHYKNEEDAVIIYDYESGSEWMVEEANAAFLKIEHTKINVTGAESEAIFNVLPEKQFSKLHLITPIYGGGKRLGTLFFGRYTDKFDISDIILGEHVATIVGVEIERRLHKQKEDLRRKKWQASMAIESLTGTELRATEYIFEELSDDVTLLVLKDIADREQITRSICLNALRKLESAGIIQSTSFGSKGTQIKILNHTFRSLLKNI